MKKALLLMISILMRLADFKILVHNQKVDDPIPLVEVSFVAGQTANLPCEFSRSIRNETPVMLFWYKSGIGPIENEDIPIYSVDGRSKSLKAGKKWSDPKVFADRANAVLNKDTALLQILSLMPEDAGIYRCRIDFLHHPTKVKKIHLTVIVPPPSPEIYTTGRTLAKNLQPFTEGTELVLICEVTGGSPLPHLIWYRNNKPFDATYDHVDDVTVNRLDVDKVTRDLFRDKFLCKANNTLMVPPTTAEIIIDVNLKPLIVNITNKVPHLSALRTYDIECISSGSRPEAVITWYKGNHQVKHMARNFAEGPNMTRSVMSYVPTIEDNGKYLTCRAENPVVPNSGLEDQWHLTVHYVPVVTIKLGSSLRASDINEGDDVYFECEVKANPKAYKLAWFKDGKELHNNASANVIVPSDHSLVLQRVTRTSAGEYSCMAANYEGKATSRPVTLDVMYAPVCKDGTTTQVVGALKHETISLVCGVQSKPPPTSFQWTFNNSGELMNMPSDRYAQVKPQHLITNHWHGSRLNYTPASDMDYGTIACLATNQIGPQKVPCLFQIIVAGKPYPLQNCSALQSTGPYAYRMGHEDFKATDARDADWLIVRCNEGFDGGLPITSYELEVYSDENVYHVNTIYINHTDKASATVGGNTLGGPIFEVPGLEPGRNYRLLLYAVNAKGRSDPVVLESVTLKGVAMYTTGRDSSDESTDYSLLVACFAGGVTAICILIVGVTLTLYRRSHHLQPTKTQTHVVHYTPAAAGATSADALVTANDDLRQPQHQLTLTRAQVRQEYELQQRRPDPLKDHHTLDAFARLTTPTSTTTTTTTTTATNSRELADGAPEDDPDIIPSSKAERRPDIFEPNYAPKPERIRDFRRHLQDEDLSYAATLLPQEKDTWLRQNGVYQVIENDETDEVTDDGSPSMTRPSTLPVSQRAHDIYTRSLRVQESCI